MKSINQVRILEGTVLLRANTHLFLLQVNSAEVF